MKIMEESKGRIEDYLLEDHKTSKEVRDLDRITHPLNVTHVIRWDTFLENVLLIKISSRRRTTSTMPIHLKKINQIKRGLEKTKTLVKSMS